MSHGVPAILVIPAMLVIIMVSKSGNRALNGVLLVLLLGGLTVLAVASAANNEAGPALGLFGLVGAFLVFGAIKRLRR